MLVKQHEHGDRGSSFTQYIAMGVLAAIIVAGLAVAGLGATVSRGVAIVVCRIVTLDTGDCGIPGGNTATPTKPNYLPVYCDALVKSHSESLTGKLDVGIWQFSFGANYTLIWEKLANGEVWITVVPHDYKAGASFNVGENVNLGGGLHAALGDTYQFQSDDEANKWVNTLKDNVDEHNPMTWRFWNPFDGGEKDMGRPAIKSESIGVDAAAKLDLKVPGNAVDVGGGASASFSSDVIKEDWHFNDPKNHRYWDNTSYSFKMSGEFEVHVGADYKKGGAKYGAEVGAKRKWSATVRYMYNPDGSIANIRWITTYEAGNKGKVKFGPDKPAKLGEDKKDDPSTGIGADRSNEVTRMTQLNFDDPKTITDPNQKAEAQRQQQIAHDYIHKHGVVPPIPIVNAITGNTNAVTEDPGPNADPFTRLMYEKGKAWEWNSTNTNIVKNLINSPALDATSSDLTKVTNNAKYLGAPENGHRDYVNFPACEASKVPKAHDWRLDGY